MADKLIEGLIARLPRGTPDADLYRDLGLGGIAERMERTPQDPVYHAEGSVLTHSLMVAERIADSQEYAEADGEGRLILMLSALLHDAGKPATTVIDGERISSPNHSSVGAKIARELMWRDMGLCGTKERQGIREAVCAAVRHHSFPVFAMDHKDAERRLCAIAQIGALTEGFSINRLICLERADILGRYGSSAQRQSERLEYCRMLANELGILDTPYPFASEYSRRAYFKRSLNYRDAELYRDSYGEVILTCALPGTGKDTWIKRVHPDLPTVSLDDIRARMGVSPTDNQGPVIQQAHADARKHLRAREPFVWNATSLTGELRAKQIALFEQYGASVRSVFLETEWQEGLRRNAERKAEVPTAVIERMLGRLEPPEMTECESVDWLIS